MKNQYLHIAGICLALTGTGLAQKIIPNHAVANLVLGQADFVTTSSVFPRNPFTLTSPRGVAIDPVTGKVFVSEADTNRVLRFPNAASLTNGSGAEAVFGQVNFSSTSAASGQQGMNLPRGIFIDRRGRLWVAEFSNHRVLMFEAAVFRNSSPFADRVLGQPNFATVAPGTTPSKMNNPSGMFVDSADRLWVADTANHRVLRFDNVTTKGNGANADGVLGQGLFTTAAPSGAATGMNSPQDVAVSASGTLYVADSGNHRVLRIGNAAALANGSAATGVLGQIDFASISPGLSATRMNTPQSVSLTPDDSLWVSDGANARVIRFRNVATKPSGSAADGVVGQAGFTTNAASPTNRRLSLSVAGFSTQNFVDTAGNLWTADRSHNRVLRFPPDTTLPSLTVSPKPPRTTKKARQLIRGAASDFYGIARVQYRINNGAPKNANGTTAWRFNAALKKGNNTIKINAVDSVGNLSAPRIFKIRRN